ncbi:MAG: group II intron reverse transcriptase/maturase [Anaerolineae bacterium]
MSPELRRIAEKARTDRRVQFTSVAHLITVEALEEAWRALKKRSSAGIDGVTAAEYERDLRGNLERLHERLRRGRYVAPPVRRAYVPKAGGSSRPIGVPTIEDKIVQAAVARILSAIYEADFLPCSYGFRPGRSAHQALEALDQAIFRGRVSWVLDADISAFFDSMDHGVLRQFLEYRVKDRSLLRLIAKWLHAGVLEDGVVFHPVTGTPQGGVISPILSNVYLHYALDLWAEQVMRPQLRGEFYMARYADDGVFAFQYRDDAEWFAAALRGRLGKFGLRLNEAKTRLIEFGRFAAGNAVRRNRKLETFDFLGFTHSCGTSRTGRFKVLRRTAATRLRRAITRVTAWCRAHRHLPVPEQWRYLCSVLRGHYQYYGITGNIASLRGFLAQVTRVWRKWLDRRSQRGRMSWERFGQLLLRHPLPAAWLPHSVYRTA